MGSSARRRPTSLTFSLTASCLVGRCRCFPPTLAVEVDLVGRLLNYHPSATVVRLLTTNALIAYITSWVLYLSGASEDPRLLLPAWISITTVSVLSSIYGHMSYI
jgi:hypothetical protein